MRFKTIALAFGMLLASSILVQADEISDCNGEKPDMVIKGCTQLIQGGKANNEALAIAYFNRANAFDDNGDHDGAIADYTQSIKLKPDYAQSHFNRGLAYLDKQDYARAIADFNQTVKLQPKFAKAYFNLGRAYEGKGDLKKALASYLEAASFAPTNATVQTKIAQLKQKLGQ